MSGPAQNECGQNERGRNERGTVLLTTLLIMTVMAAITVALMDDIRVAVKRTINVQAYAQADWQATGAEDFVTAFLTNDFAQLPPIGKAALFRSETPLILPTPDGVISLRLKDASHCFNLNSIIDNTGVRNTEPVSSGNPPAETSNHPNTFVPDAVRVAELPEQTVSPVTVVGVVGKLIVM